VWVIKGLLFLALLFVLVYFFVANAGETVDLRAFGREYLAVSVYWVVVVSFLLGFATSFVMAALREFRFHREIGRLRRDGKRKDQEIADLRTLPLRDAAEVIDPAAEDTARE
jgi:hypothetical protein